MSRFLINPTIARHLSSAALLLALGLASCEQPQALPVAAAPLDAASAQPNHYYLNARRSSNEEIEQLNPSSITSVAVLKGQQAADYTHDAGVKSVVVVQTR